MDYNLWQKLVNRATLPIQYLFGDREKVRDFQESEMNDFAKLLLDTTKPFRTGANILAQNYGSTLTGKDMSRGENQGKFLKMLAGAITPEEQDYINRKPYMAAAKSGAGFGEALISLLVPGYAGFKNVANPLLRKSLQIATRAIPEGALPGFSYSREGKELQDTGIGTALSLLTHFGSNYAFDPQFRKMITEASTYTDPTTGRTMYRGGLGDDDIKINYYADEPDTPKIADNDIKITKPYDELVDQDNPLISMDDAVVDKRGLKYPESRVFDSNNYIDPDRPIVDLLKDDPIAKLEIEARNYGTPEEFIKAQKTPKTVKVWIKSKFSNGGSYADIPVIGKVEDITLYQGGAGEGRQFWTPDRKYAEQFGDVVKKKGTFYKVDNGNRVTDVYVEAPTKIQLRDLWEKAWGLMEKSKDEILRGFKEVAEKAGKDGIK